MSELTAVLVRRGVMRLSGSLREGSGSMGERFRGRCDSGAVRKRGKSVIEVDVWARSVVFAVYFRTRAVVGSE